MHIAHPTAQLPCGLPRRLALPLPVADVEGHAQAQPKRVGTLEELQQRFDPATLCGLIVFHQQQRPMRRQKRCQGGDIAVRIEVPQGNLQRYSAKRPRSFQLRDQ
ncbi:hypothetical protein D3C81_1693810 [compost metagenome]